MTSLNVTTKQYHLRWSGEFSKWNYSSSNLGGLFQSEKEINDYLQDMVNHGWIVLETSIEEIN
jgi:hypothetical protein